MTPTVHQDCFVLLYWKLKTYSWKLKKVYWKLKTIENELRLTGPNLVLLLATRCLYWGYIWAPVNWTQLSTTLGHRMPLQGGPSDLSTKRTSENLNTLCVSCFASQKSFLQKSKQFLLTQLDVQGACNAIFLMINNKYYMYFQCILI